MSSKSKVFFTSLTAGDRTKEIEEKLLKLCDAVGLASRIDKTDLVAIKMHFGERGNVTHIQPKLIRPLVKFITKIGAKPFLTDTTVLYKSPRSDAISHLRVAHEHGFTIDKVGAPVIIADGLVGDAEDDVAIPGKLFKTVSLAREILKANALIVVTHVTGHMACGLGGTIKNLGMGLASRKGKMRQHSAIKPEVIDSKCTACELCITWCPEAAITMQDGTAVIDSKKCNGCGECLTVCRFNAICYDWNVSNKNLQKRIAEHALGAVIGREHKCVYFNYIITVTKDCDCFGKKMIPIMPDIGVLASTDPVAVDQATLDMIQSHAGKSFRQMAYSNVDETYQLRHGEKIGLGVMEYELYEI
jgi:uncharacterized Fe-S center protein